MSYYADLYHYMETVVWPGSTSTPIDGIYRLYGAGLLPSYPCHVLDSDGNFRSATTAFDNVSYCTRWNSYVHNQVIGVLYPGVTPFTFTILLNPGQTVPILYGDYLVLNEENEPIQNESGSYFINENPF